jgi:hypothetical protein
MRGDYKNMSKRKYVSLDRLADYDALIKQKIVNSVSGKADKGHSHDDIYYTEKEIDVKIDTINELLSQKSQVQIITWEDGD